MVPPVKPDLSTVDLVALLDGDGSILFVRNLYLGFFLLAIPSGRDFASLSSVAEIAEERLL